jgi:multidrug efflux pump subunit AcrA (membrane-fusion protein)
MFRRSHEPTFFTRGRPRSRWRLPGWLWLLLFGLAAGAAGLLLVQERYLPTRLSAEASAALRSAYEQADAERQRLAQALQQNQQKLELALAEKQSLAKELGSSRSTVERLQAGLAGVVEALPPDPRKGQVAVRAARFTASGGMLAYDVVLTRERTGSQPMNAVMQLVVSGGTTGRGDSAVALKPVALALGRHEVLRGSLALPAGFVPHQATVQVLDRPAGKLLGMRVWLLKEPG